MPDYTSILRRSISALPDAAPGMREAVYQRARAALARQLTAVDPPLSSREIEAQHQQLENAVALIEAEFAPEPAPAAKSPPPPPARLDPYRPARSEERPAEPPRSEPARAEPKPADPVRPEPVRAESLRQEPKRSEPARTEPAWHGPAPSQAAELVAARGDEDFDSADDYDDEEEVSRAPLAIALAVLALILLGGGALVYAQRDLVASWTGLPIGSQQAAVAPPAQPADAEPETPPGPAELPAVDPNSGKRPDRLTNGETTPALTAEPEPDIAQAPEPEPLTEVQPPAGLGPDAVQPPADPAPPPPAPGAPAPAPPPAAGESLVAQRAIFYEQGTEGAPGQAWQGSVTWSQIARPDGSAGIQAVLQLPDQNVTTTISIYRNSDETLPASHLVEIQFSGDGRLGPAAVERVPALVLKPNEQARGQPLSGAAVPVTENLFWIALSSEEEQIARNLSLLREGSWFDLPILFMGGQRALITFEKGIPGDKVFEAVLAGWAPPP